MRLVFYVKGNGLVLSAVLTLLALAASAAPTVAQDFTSLQADRCFRCFELNPPGGTTHHFSPSIICEPQTGSFSLRGNEGVCRECDGVGQTLTEARGAEEGHDHCHADQTPPSANLSCNDHPDCKDNTLALREDVTGLLSRSEGTDISEPLRALVSATPNLVYRLASNTLELRDCGGELVDAWPASDEVRAAFVTE